MGEPQFLGEKQGLVWGVALIARYHRKVRFRVVLEACWWHLNGFVLQGSRGFTLTGRHGPVQTLPAIWEWFLGH